MRWRELEEKVRGEEEDEGMEREVEERLRGGGRQGVDRGKGE